MKEITILITSRELELKNGEKIEGNFKKKIKELSSLTRGAYREGQSK